MQFWKIQINLVRLTHYKITKQGFKSQWFIWELIPGNIEGWGVVRKRNKEGKNQPTWSPGAGSPGNSGRQPEHGSELSFPRAEEAWVWSLI